MGNLCLRKKERSQQPQYNIADENHIIYTPASLNELDKIIKIESQEALILNIQNKQDQFQYENNQNTIQILNELDKDALIKQGQLAKEELSKIKQQQYDDAVLYFGKQSLKENLPIKSEQNDEQSVQIELERIRGQQYIQQQRDQQQEHQKFIQKQEVEKLRLQKYEQEIIQIEVKVLRSWLNWIDKIELLQKDNRFEIEVNIPTGNHQFKFIVDDEWKVSDQNEYNGQNNLINV
ncbi:unnamed protein product [Paramecium pentaurelia]|uniref:AMP-activated protein kinase glycogen-binding domain-containing protein n=1 Tax=Paramecium pentaurelia TaxID=43138 RepID=A0A8S1UGW9_9CILI|nr:unnamed protein product [Paramecium pentaurelia]